MADITKKILIIEDEMKFARIMKMRLESQGYLVETAGDAYGGTQKIIKQDFDLIILDLNMPAGGGFSILERVSHFPAKAEIPVIIITGRTITDSLQQKADVHGVFKVLNKPVDTQVFLDTISRSMKVPEGM